MSILNTALIQKLRKLKADKSNVLELDNTDTYTPVDDYNPSTKKYVDDGIDGIVSGTKLITTDRILISGNEIELPSKAYGSVVNSAAFIYLNTSTNVIMEYTCRVSADGWFIEFNQFDNLNGRYAVVTFLTVPLASPPQ